MIRKWIRSLDVRLAIIAALLVSDAGHCGHLFSVREASDRTFIGYLLAFCLDATSGIALYDMIHVRKGSRRFCAVCAFTFAGLVAGGFSLAYYRDTSPADPLWVSLLMALTAPILAGFLSILRAFNSVERSETDQAEREAERALELEKYTIEQAEQTRREHLVAQERTKQERARARGERARADASTREVQPERGNGRLRPGELDDIARTVLLEQPGIGPRPLARVLGCSPSTASGILKRLNVSRAEGQDSKTG